MRARVTLSFGFNECVNASAASAMRDVDADRLRRQTSEQPLNGCEIRVCFTVADVSHVSDDRAS